MTKHIPWGDICAVGVQNLGFVAVVEIHGLQVNMPNRFDYTVHQQHIPHNDFETLKAPGPNCSVPNPNMFRSFDKPVGHGPVVEVGRWARLGIESATSGLDLFCMERDSRAVIPLLEVGEPIAEEGQRREGAEGKELDE